MQVGAVELLMRSRGVDPRATDLCGSTALIDAAANGQGGSALQHLAL